MESVTRSRLLPTTTREASGEYARTRLHHLFAESMVDGWDMSYTARAMVVFRKYVTVIEEKRSCPAVSQSETGLPFTTRSKKHVPTVGMWLSEKPSFTRRCAMDVLPTPVSPTSTILSMVGM